MENVLLKSSLLSNFSSYKRADKLILLYLVFLACYPFLVFPSEAKWTLINFFIYFCSSFLCISCFLSCKKMGIQSWNLFGSVYFFSLWLNTLQLSTLQVEKNLLDIYTLLVGPTIFMLLLRFMEKITISSPRLILKIININYIYVILTTVYILLSFYNYTQVGWRFDAIQSQHRIVSGEEFVIPFFSGMWATISWVLVILSPHVKKKAAFIALICIFIFSGILHVKRGDIVRIFLFLIIFLLSSKTFFSKSSFRKFIPFFLFGFVLIIFVVFGQWRLAQAGSDGTAILNLTEMRIENVYLAWLFGYLVVQFDVFSLSAASLQNIPYLMLDLHQLLTSNLPELEPLIPIKGFNAGTMFWSFYRDFGSFFFVEMFVFCFLISGLVWLSKKVCCKGAYYFVCLLSALSVFGNYFCNRSMVLAIIFSNMIYIFSYTHARGKIG